VNVPLPRLGLGTVKLGRTAGLRLAGTPTPLPTDEEARTLLATALEVGATLIDTAPAYGLSEPRLGALLPTLAPRERWTIVTKAGETFHPGAPPADGHSTYDFTPAALRASLDASLHALRTDFTDGLLLHFASTIDDHAALTSGEAMGTLLDLQRRGKARRVGISAATVRGALLALDQGADLLMLTVNPASPVHLPAALEAARRGVPVLAKKALSGGRESDPASAVRFALAQPGVSCVVAGTTNPQHLRQLAAATSAGPDEAP
jgi:aryl-alcohol dehydrogenase-like predicted oxidoreductase